jgi:hypothetical protein
MGSPVDPYLGPSTLDAYLDTLRDPLDPRPRPATGEDMHAAMHAADAAGAPAFICRRGEPPARPALGPSPMTAKTKAAQGEIDRAKLRAAIDDPGCGDKARDDFEDMLGRIHPQFGEYPCLTDKQRGYVDNVLRELGIDEQTPAQRNARATSGPARGREVPLNLGALPTKPPPQRVRGFTEALCSARSGGRDVDCLQCGGDCPFVDWSQSF